MTGTVIRVGSALGVAAAVVGYAAISPPAAAQGGLGAPVICVGADGVLKARTAACAAGEAPVPLAATPSPADSEPAAGKGARPSTVQQNPTVELERRIAELERSNVFEVVDAANRPIFTAAPGAVRVFSKDGTAVASMTADADGGMMTARSTDIGLRAVSIDADGLRVMQSGQERIALGRRETGTYSLRFMSSAGMVAGIGESQAGTGLIAVNDRGGRPRATISVVDGKGAFSVLNAAGETVAGLTVGQSGGGLLATADAAGEPIVKMGSSPKGYGVVLTGPAAGLPFVPKSGLPGSYLLGCAGGPSCVPE